MQASAISIERRACPPMPVLCDRCAHAVPGLLPEFIHCIHGPRSEVRLRELGRLCDSFEPKRAA